MATWSFYQNETGLISHMRYGGPQAYLAQNTPAGCIAIPGEYDHLSQRFDLVAGEVVDYVPPAPQDTEHYTHEWDTVIRRHVAVPTLAKLKLDARAAIDQAAGQARMRYITEVAGQQATYVRKLEQAQQYAAAGYTGTVPPYIAAEASATGDTAQQVADTILATAAQWDDLLSPGIEGARIGGKRAVSAATTAADVQSAMTAAVSALEAF